MVKVIAPVVVGVAGVSLWIVRIVRTYKKVLKLYALAGQLRAVLALTADTVELYQSSVAPESPGGEELTDEEKENVAAALIYLLDEVRELVDQIDKILAGEY